MMECQHALIVHVPGFTGPTPCYEHLFALGCIQSKKVTRHPVSDGGYVLLYSGLISDAFNRFVE